MEKLYGWTGSLLRMDLPSGDCRVNDLARPPPSCRKREVYLMKTRHWLRS